VTKKKKSKKERPRPGWRPKVAMVRRVSKKSGSRSKIQSILGEGTGEAGKTERKEGSGKEE